MEHRDLLQTIAEVGAALAGLAAVISIFRGRLSESDHLVQIHSARNIAESSLIVVLLSFAPPVIHGLGANPSLAWRASSALAALALLAQMLFLMPRLRKLARSANLGSLFAYEPGLSIPAFLIGLLTLVMLASNALGFFERAPSIYVLSLVGVLAIAGMIFVRLIMIGARGLE